MNLHHHIFNLNQYKYIFLAFFGMSFIACSEKTPQENATTAVASEQAVMPLATVSIANSLDTAVKESVIAIELGKLGLDADADSNAYVFRNGKDTLPHQFIDSNADGVHDRALILTDLAPAEKIQVSMQAADDGEVARKQKRTHAEVSIKRGGQWNGSVYEGGTFHNVETVTLPPNYTDHSEFIRYEGPGIESDKIGYRVYLDWRNGFDIFGKKEVGLHLNRVGLDGYQSYHEPADWGMDILKVGKAVGVGGFGAWVGGALERMSNVQSWTTSIVEDGDLYSSFTIDYKGWESGGINHDLRAQLSMVAGSSSATVDITTDPSVNQLAVGIVKHEGTVLLQGNIDITGEAWSYIATLGHQSLDGQPLLLYVLFKREIFDALVEDEFNHALLLKVRGGDLSYKFGAYWAGEPGSDLSINAVTAMLQHEVERLTYPPRLSVSNAASKAFKKQLGGIESALKWSKLLAESEVKRIGKELEFGEFDSARERDANWEYTTGMAAQSVYQVGKVLGDKALMQWGKSVVDSYITDDGEIETYDVDIYNIDSINSGKMLIELFKDTGEKRYFLAAKRLREQLRYHPRLELGAFWHKQRYPYQLWLDGVYMGMPFLAEYTMLFEDGSALGEVIEEFRVVREHLRDAETGLYFHALDEKKIQVWADPATGLSHYFWARGMGWLAMAIVDTLDFIPKSHNRERQELIAMAKELADSLIRVQDNNGVWHQIIDKAGKVGNYPEASSSSMFTYFFVKGVVKGVLPEHYRMVAEKSYDALIREFVLVDVDSNILLTQNCMVGGLGFGRDGSYEYYMSEPVVDNDPKGIAPFLMIGPLALNAFAK